MQRDSIDFGTMKVGALFRKQLVPTVLGMVFSALFVITDGIFVGRGIGSDALAAVNIAAPLSVFAAGVGLMFGMGGAIVASINLSRGKARVANINATQAVLGGTIVMFLISLAICFFPSATARLLGAPEDIIHLAVEYLFAYALFAVFQTLLNMLTFFVRIDGPKVAMWGMTIAALLNIVLDYLFIFVFHWGLTGAAVATGIGEIVGAVILFRYLQYRSPRIRMGRLKVSRKSLMLSGRNTGYIVRLGFSAFLGEVSIAIMMLTGNYVFVRYLGTDGVAAFSIVCYFFPIIFMLFNAIIQSAQPIISFNYGCGSDDRARKAFRMALWTAIGVGLFFDLFFTVLREPVVSLFITDRTNEAWKIAVAGIPFFASGYVFFGINLAAVGYYMSIEKTGRATLYTLLRGVILPVISFFTLPLFWGVPGIWGAVPVAEILTSAVIGAALLVQRIKTHGKIHPVHT